MNLFRLMKPYFLSARRRFHRDGNRERIRSLVFFLIGSGFWAATFWGLWRVLVYFRGIETIGELLAAKLLSMILLTFFTLLVFSNMVTALSTFFLSRDLTLLWSLPIPIDALYLTRLLETIFSSSWMVLLFGTPVFLVYGLVFDAGALYYLALILALPPFLVIPAALGQGIVMALGRFVPARKARDILIFMALCFGVGLYLLVRFLQPERLVNPETFETVLSYLAALRTPSHGLLPSHWMIQVLLPFLMDRGGDPAFYLGMLWSTAGAFLVLGGWWTAWHYPEAWSRALAGRRLRTLPRPFTEALVRGLSVFFPRRYRMVISKDLRVFFRDSTQWSQLLLLVALVVVYIYNVSVLPLSQETFGGWFLQNLLAFLNTGLTGFVVAAIAVRFVFPAVSLEGRAYWILQSSPIPLKDLLWGKFWASFLPLVLLAEVLIVSTNALLRVSGFMMGLSVGTVLLVTMGLTGMGVGMGAIYPRFEVENVAQIPSSFGGLLYMILAVGFIGVILLLEAVPVYLVFSARFYGSALSSGSMAAIAFSFLLLVMLFALALWVPMQRGLLALKAFEEGSSGP